MKIYFLFLFIGQFSFAQLQPEMVTPPQVLFVSIQQPNSLFSRAIVVAIREFINEIAITNKNAKIIFLGDTQNLNLFLSAHSDLSNLLKNVQYEFAHRKSSFIHQNSPWVRDFAPLKYKNKLGLNKVLGMNYHLDITGEYKQAQIHVAEALNVEINFFNLQAEGGNFLSDADGRLFISKRLFSYNQNYTESEIDEHLKKYLNVQDIIWITPPPSHLEATGHVDMYLRFISHQKAIVARSSHAEINIYLDAMADTIEKLGYEVHRLDFEWQKDNPTGSSFSVFKSYTNIIQLNKKILMPVYGNLYDQSAKELYQKLGFEVVPISGESIHYGGSIHCLTYLYY